MRPGEELKDGPPIHGNTRLEVIWTAIPAIILVALCSYAYVVLRDIETAEAREMKVRVVGEQFTWTFFYPGKGGGKEIASNQLYLPKGKQVRFDIQSKDVLHDFWVPAFRQKIDAVPGHHDAVSASSRSRPAPSPSSAPSCAGSATRSCARARTSSRRRPSTSGCEDKRTKAGGGGQAGRRAEGGGAAARRQGGLHERRCAGLRLVPHALRRGRRRHHRPEPRRGAEGQGRGLHPEVDRGAERRGGQGLPGRDHAQQLQGRPSSRRRSRR